MPLLHGLSGAGAPALSTGAVAAEGVIAVSTATFERLGGLDPRMGSSRSPTSACVRRRARAADRRRVRRPDADDRRQTTA